MAKGLEQLQEALDALPDHPENWPEGWPEDICRNAWCGRWERLNGQYYFHREADHDRD